jgi:hypothetical protein
MTGPTTAIGATRTTAPNTTRFGGDQRIQLITGDRVVVGAKGRMVGFEPAKGRERIPVQVQRIKDHTLVVPSDAQRLIATGKLDQRLFDIGELTDPLLRRFTSVPPLPERPLWLPRSPVCRVRRRATGSRRHRRPPARAPSTSPLPTASSG